MKQENNCALPQEGAFRTTIGGQALIEGILMRGPEKQAIVVRNQEGELEVKEQTLKLIKDHSGASLPPGGGKLSGLPGGRGEGPDVVGGILP